MIAVWFSCGAASAVAAKFTVDKYQDVRVVYNPVMEEHPDNLRFLEAVEAWLGVPIEFATNPKYPNASAIEVWDQRAYMEGVAGAPCTLELKKMARKHWEWENEPDYHVLGFTTEEKDRHKRFIENEGRSVLPVLIDAGMTKQDCLDTVLAAGIDPPAIYREGFPNANCLGCVKATSPTYWNHLRRTHPEVFQARAEQSRRIGAKLVRYKGQRIFLDELPEGAQGRPLKSMDFGCGIFCNSDEETE
jgi:3'-phosphoadenosine 5'-phosphosulfate sulfotransferase (PAPS reductase)/FAD synthetase